MSRLKHHIMLLFIILSSSIVSLFGISYAVLHSPSFGALPSGERKERILRSPNYRDGRFQNRYPMPPSLQRPSLGDRIKILWRFLFDRPKDVRPTDSIPVVRHDLKKLDRSEDLIVWFGHSSYLLQMDGVRYLIDPVFVEGAPFGIMNAFFRGTKVFDVADLPEIDYLIITHDHWDHLDYHVAKELQRRVRKVYTGLGVGAHLERWGYRPDQIVELDWDESTSTAEGGRVHCLPTQHFSGRGLTSAQSLWASFVLRGTKHSVYVGGDGGFSPHYAVIGKQFPQLDLAILENGQYSEQWSGIHMLPEYLGKTMHALGAKRILTVHHAKFALSMHPWKEPLEHAKRLRDEEGLPILMPRIGQIVRYTDSTFTTDDWWEQLR
ncbi:MBL fold metallo-hydrolase [Porphyromonas sp.]